MVAGALNVWGERVPVTVAFLIVIPLVSVIVVVQWASQTVGIIGFGEYLHRLAVRDAYGSLPEGVFVWEEFVRNRPGTPWMYEASVIAAFSVISAASICLGAYRGWAGHEDLISIVVSVVSLLVVAVTGRVVWRFRHARNALLDTAT